MRKGVPLWPTVTPKPLVCGGKKRAATLEKTKVDVTAAQDLLGIGDRFGDAELLSGGVREVLVEVADHHHIAERRAREAGEVRAVRPAARADHADAELLFDHDPSGRSTQRRCRCESATALMTSCTEALWAKLP